MYYSISLPLHPFTLWQLQEHAHGGPSCTVDSHPNVGAEAGPLPMTHLGSSHRPPFPPCPWVRLEGGLISPSMPSSHIKIPH